MLVAVAGILLAVSACGGKKPTEATPPTVSVTSTPTASAGVSARPSVTPSGPVSFTSAVEKIPSRATLKYSWRPGCPVGIEDLRLITMTYWGMDHKSHTGEMVVNADVTGKVVKVFRTLYKDRYPIRRMELVDKYGGDDDKSIDADNSSAFNCRKATGLSIWSQHAYGHAIDLNTCENPYIDTNGNVSDHPECNKYKNRSLRVPGLIHDGDEVVRAFRSVGWGWGGHWSGPWDYQHFSVTGY
jgi:D-alanyl-D-alanine carboxypeptidase